MKIISKFNDYYDTIGQFGIDLTQLYIRKTTELSFKNHSFSDIFSSYLGDYRYHDSSIKFEPLIIGACGKLHYCIKLTAPKGLVGYVSRHCYSLDDIEDFIYELHHRKIVKNKELDKYISRLKRPPSSSKYWRYSTNRLDIGLFDRFENDIGNKDYTDLFIENGAPLLLFHDERECILTINPVMKDLEFQKVLDPFMMYQELTMFLGCVIINQTKKGTKIKKRPEGWVDPLSSDDFSDETKRDSKGFDKMSFKKEKTKRRNK